MFSYYYFTGAHSTVQQCVEWKLNAAGDDYVVVGNVDPSRFIGQIDTWISQGTSSYLPGSSRPKGYFGRWKWVPDPGNVRPEPLNIQFEDIRHPVIPDFLRRQRTGEILTSSCLSSRGSLKCDPVPVKQNDYFVGTESISHMDFPNLSAIPFKNTKSYPIQEGSRYFTIIVAYRVHGFNGSGWFLPDIGISFFDGWRGSVTVSKPLVTELLADLNEATLDLLTELAELPETVAMFRETLSLFSKRGKKLKNLGKEIRDILGGEKSLAKLPDKAANLRLMYRYGILPLKYTAEDLAKVLKDSFARAYVAKTKKAPEEGFSFERNGYSFSGGADSEMSAWCKRRLDPNSSLQQFQRVFGVNIPKTLWELTPWSLVVDWFVNVGDALTALQSTPSLEEKSTYSVKRSVVGTYTMNSRPEVILEVEFHHYERQIINAADNVCLSFNPVITSDRAIDAFAFSWQILRKNIRKLKF